jgi:hypothetical protein
VGSTDLFAAIGRRSVPASVVATVMVLQRLDGLSDREAVDRFTFGDVEPVADLIADLANPALVDQPGGRRADGSRR